MQTRSQGIIILYMDNMELWLKLIINFFLSQFALIMYANIKSDKEENHPDYRLFLLFLLFTILILIFHSLVVITNGSATLLKSRFLPVCSFATFALVQYIPLLYFFYVDGVIYKSKRKKRSKFVIMLPVFAIQVFALIFRSGGFFFFIDDAGYYRNGPFLYIPIIVGFGYIISSVGRILNNRKFMSHWEFNSLMVFSSPMIVCGSVQSFIQELPLFIPSMIISLLILYTNIMERRFSFDHLTGIFNRKKMEEYLEVMMASSKSSGTPLSAFLADVNKFKYINDTYGHTEGDRALVKVAEIIRKGIRNIDIPARYAGDEFIALFPGCAENEVKLIIERIRGKFTEFTEKNEKYPLSISIGYALYDPSIDKDTDGFIKRMDKLMYEDKKRYGGKR